MNSDRKSARKRGVAKFGRPRELGGRERQALPRRGAGCGVSCPMTEKFFHKWQQCPANSPFKSRILVIVIARFWVLTRIVDTSAITIFASASSSKAINGIVEKGIISGNPSNHLVIRPRPSSL